MSTSSNKLQATLFTNVHIDDPFWAPRLQINREVTLQREYDLCKETGRLDAFKLTWKPGKPHQPHHFWDSDVAKWVEAAAYSLATHPDKGLEIKLEQVVQDIIAAQQPDGYLNTYFTSVAPTERWTNLYTMHELYCAGHLMEAAVAHHAATGKRTLLDCLCRYADYIDATFGPGQGKRRGAPGHPEIELALVRLYRATNEQRYLHLARYFVDERGHSPNTFHEESNSLDSRTLTEGDLRQIQAHLPVLAQETAEGHAVRACYLFAGMADVAHETQDADLRKACRRLWNNLTERRMYVTGGIGSSRHGECFTEDYDLPNETSYAETCAAIALLFFAHRMLHLEEDARYADMMERALYNGILSGVSLDGTHFFYANPLAVKPCRSDALRADHIQTTRQGWFGCSCCPPNIARLLASLGQYIYSSKTDSAWIHLYIGSETEMQLAGQTVQFRQATEYPWNTRVRLDVSPESSATFSLMLRMPGWCRAAKVWVNGEDISDSATLRKGYLCIRRTWEAQDIVEMELPMPIERLEAHPSVRHNCGRIALQRGPVVYCLEEIDNGADLNDLYLPGNVQLKTKKMSQLGGIPAISGHAQRRQQSGWGHTLYRPAEQSAKRVPITAIPYFLWNNRGVGEMLVWLRGEPAPSDE